MLSLGECNASPPKIPRMAMPTPRNSRPTAQKHNVSAKIMEPKPLQDDKKYAPPVESVWASVQRQDGAIKELDAALTKLQENNNWSGVAVQSLEKCGEMKLKIAELALVISNFQQGVETGFAGISKAMEWLNTQVYKNKGGVTKTQERLHEIDGQIHDWCQEKRRLYARVEDLERVVANLTASPKIAETGLEVGNDLIPDDSASVRVMADFSIVRPHEHETAHQPEQDGEVDEGHKADEKEESECWLAYDGEEAERYLIDEAKNDPAIKAWIEALTAKAPDNDGEYNSSSVGKSTSPTVELGRRLSSGHVNCVSSDEKPVLTSEAATSPVDNVHKAAVPQTPARAGNGFQRAPTSSLHRAGGCANLKERFNAGAQACGSTNARSAWSFRTSELYELPPPKAAASVVFKGRSPRAVSPDLPSSPPAEGSVVYQGRPSSSPHRSSPRSLEPFPPFDPNYLPSSDLSLPEINTPNAVDGTHDPTAWDDSPMHHHYDPDAGTPVNMRILVAGPVSEVEYEDDSSSEYLVLSNPQDHFVPLEVEDDSSSTYQILTDPNEHYVHGAADENLSSEYPLLSDPAAHYLNPAFQNNTAQNYYKVLAHQDVDLATGAVPELDRPTMEDDEEDGGIYVGDVDPSDNFIRNGSNNKPLPIITAPPKESVGRCFAKNLKKVFKKMKKSLMSVFKRK
ncbi:hypothetical protein BDY21DRAFT_370402 [Lineolata rhizophorae]|uniref:Uncharacterized protein n=1 Tax=Lineolata rhizophorae TaxID=578093 RepID=A0A6A6P507_9PEZI|nr:hypothetical protein BDY21DRAFT_370402 [Lineolata rhizophorae]